MTTSSSLSGGALSPKPPAKGSFPLDHFSECKQFALAYETCLQSHDRVTSHCRKEARAYLQCRMERGLMAKEGWDKLGLEKDEIETGGSTNLDERAEEGGFVAGARSAKRRKERYKKEDVSE